MKPLLLIGTLALSLLPAHGGDPAQFDTLYAELLKAYRRPPAVIEGTRTVVFDFKSMADDAKDKDSLFARTLAAFEASDTGLLKTPDDEKAFWINAYNLGAIKLVVENYPIRSIRDKKVSLTSYPWSKPLIGTGNKRLSLEGIEQDKLLKRFKDPRIVFAVNCATISCPDLPAEPFQGKTLDKQLDALMRDYLGNPTKGLRINRETGEIQISWIFEKHEDLIREGLGGIPATIHRYLDPATCEWYKQHEKHTTVKYLNHDWTLNDTALAKPSE